MTDGELQLEVIRILEEVTGAAATFDSPEALIGTFCRRMQLDDASEFGFLIDVGRDHWSRQSWLRTHAAHGILEWVEPENCVQPPYWHWGSGVYAVCSCGERLAILWELVPPESVPLVARRSVRQ